jgi:T5SS/PEP-CTERM-associated repeat protein
MARSAIVGTGDIRPGLEEWDETATCYVGHSEPGSLTLDGGSDLVSSHVFVGTYKQAVGDVTMTGAGTTWQCINNFELGTYVVANMTIADNAALTVGETMYVAAEVGSSAMLHFDTGGSLTTKNLTASPNDLSGSGVIHTRGLVSDLDLVFDSPASLHQTLLVDGQDVAIDLDMSDPASNGWLGAGHRGRGSTTVTNGADVTSNDWACLGYRADGRGELNVDGAGSTWTHLDDMAIGYFGRGYLNIRNGGQVIGGGGCSIGYRLGAYGEVTISGANSKWSDLPDLTIARAGDGAVNVVDGGELTVTTSCSIGHFKGSGSLTVSGAGSRWTAECSANLGSLPEANGTLRILDGGHGESNGGSIAIFGDSTGRVTVSGAGSTWINHGDLHVGRDNDGRMTVAAGGVVTCEDGTIGRNSTGIGRALVCGNASNWSNSGSLQIGKSGSGTLAIAGGGTVSAASVSIGNSQSLLSIEVNGDSRLTVGGGSGAVTNNGTVRLIAGAAPSAGASFTPVSAGAWSGSGNVESLGGVWNESFHTFTASSVAQGSPGAPISLTLSSKQRVKVSDSVTDWTLGASFRATTSWESLSVTATPIDGSVLDDLETELFVVESVLGGWLFETSGEYAAGDPAYLSFEIGSGYSADEIQPWRYTGSEWVEYDPADFVYDGTYASFTVDELVGFAVATVVKITLPGDANGDGAVDEADAARLADNWGQSGGWKQGDFNDDGVVGLPDAAILAANWGYGTEQSGEANGVPEPGMLAILLVGVLMLAVRRCR